MPADDTQLEGDGTSPPTGRHHDNGGLDDLYDIARLARRLDVEHATIRVWLSRKVPWLPPPDGRLNGGAVWRATTLEGIEERRFRRRPGRKPRFTVAPAAADVPRTGAIPIVAPRTGAVPVVAPRTGTIPVVAARTGAVPVAGSRTDQHTLVPAPVTAAEADGAVAAPGPDPFLTL